MNTGKEKAPGKLGGSGALKSNYSLQHFTRFALIVLLAASSGAGLALLSVAAVKMIGGAP